MNVPFIDLNAQYRSIAAEIDAAIASTIADSAFIKSPSVTQFEEEFGAFLGAEHVIACGNGTDAIEIMLNAMGIGEGDEVLVPAVTWIATSEAAATNGAKPVFVDVDSETYTIDPKLIEEKITKATKAIIPVHLYGHPADMAEIMRIAKKHDLKVIEDCAQAHGAKIEGQTIGTIGDAATFSFFPTKNLGAYGDAGAMVTNDEKLAETAQAIANHGQTQRHHHTMDGRNSRMDGLQASILSVKLKYLEKWTDSRRRIAENYRENLAGLNGITLPSEPKNGRHVYHLFVIRTENRNELMDYLSEHGISSMVHYPKALPFQACYEYQNNSFSDYPVAKICQDNLLSIPLYPEISDEQVAYVVECISKFVDR
ncbi:MAG: DegT/DnrJ/EryC1/StrS family aminotransferase [Pricia sp.]